MISTERLATLFAAGSIAAVLAVAYSLSRQDTARVQAQPPTPQPTPAPRVTKVKANELGRIPILMYHSVDEPRTPYDRHGLNIHGATFRKHLAMMVKAGWYPMNVRDLYIPEKLQAVPAGLTPVALTFDDARGSQFRLRKDGTIDPNCVVGILEAFHAKYGERWPQRGSFYVLPRSQYNPTPFWQSGLEAKKCRWLVERGYELGNHSSTHHNLGPMGKDALIREVSYCTKVFQKLAPGATMDTFCVPYGSYPKNKALWPYLLTDGTPTSPYNNKIALKAWGDESFAPLDKRFDSHQVDRIGVDPGYFERVFARLTKSGKLYVSDGDPNTVTIPRSWEPFLVKSRTDGREVVVTGPAVIPGKTAAKPSTPPRRKP